MTPAEVREARKQLRLSQAKFARVMGVSVKTVQFWEWDQRKPSPTAARLIALYLVLHTAAPKLLPGDWPPPPAEDTP